MSNTPPLKRLNFERNFNNKLKCPFFVEIRLHMPEFYKGAKYELWCDGLYYGVAECTNLVKAPFSEFSIEMLQYDTGLETMADNLALFQSFYPKSDLKRDKFAFMHMKKIDKGFKMPSLFND